jgi:hypothetical protein
MRYTSSADLAREGEAAAALAAPVAGKEGKRSWGTASGHRRTATGAANDAKSVRATTTDGIETRGNAAILLARLNVAVCTRVGRLSDV